MLKLKAISVFIIVVQLFIDKTLADQRTSYRKCHEIYFNESTSQRIVRSVQHRITRSSDLGKIPTSIGEFPYMAALGFKDDSDSYSYLCGGVLISPDYILTTAVCSNSREFGEVAIARIGGFSLDDSHPEANIPISSIHVHPEYKRGAFYNDIALLKLKEPSTQTPACLWQTNEIDSSYGTAIGYGVTVLYGDSSKDLLKVVLDFFSNEECKKFYTTEQRRLKDGIKESQVCSGDRNGTKDTCQGDSGGPIIVKMNKDEKQVPYVVGLISFGLGCGTGIPSVSTRVSSYLDWIESIVWQ